MKQMRLKTKKLWSLFCFDLVFWFKKNSFYYEILTVVLRVAARWSYRTWSPGEAFSNGLTVSTFTLSRRPEVKNSSFLLIPHSILWVGDGSRSKLTCYHHPSVYISVTAGICSLPCLWIFFCSIVFIVLIFIFIQQPWVFWLDYNK